MENNTFYWIVLIMFLFISTFGIFWLFTTITGVLMFLLGFISLLYLKQGDVEKFYTNCRSNPLVENDDSFVCSESGLKPIVEQLASPKKVQKTDSRVTGSDLIDSSLQEILGYIIRDYVHPWYSLISRDLEFPNTTVRQTAQTFAINISNRVKDVDWIPYLTTRLVDDAASHLRLYKQARTKMKNLETIKTSRNSPLRDKSSPKKATHKRNKSETDINWYSGKNEARKDVEKNVGSSRVYTGDNRRVALEEHFFDLECQMEHDIICRDTICTDVLSEKEFLNELVEILLYILLPDEDFECKPLCFVLREIFVKCVIIPLFNMLSDPDYINQAIIWLCLRDSQLPSEIFLTTLRLTDNCDELKSTKDLITKEMQLLRSRDSGGESDLSIKQQLSSLTYVLKLIDNRLSKMENIEALDSQTPLDYVQMESIKKIHLTLDQILQHNVALSYFIDYVSNQGKLDYIFFYIATDGWKTSVEEHFNELYKTKNTPENIAVTHETLRTLALNLFDEYLGDKCEEKVQIKPALVQKLRFKIRNLNEIPSVTWFDEVRQAVYDKLESDSAFLPGFVKSRAYIKLLQELDLVQNAVQDEEDLEQPVVVERKLSDGIPKKDLLTVESCSSIEKSVKHARSFSDVTMLSVKSDSEGKSSQDDNETTKIETLKTGEYKLTVNIIETGIVCERGKTFGIYAIRVSRRYDTGYSEDWHIYRRYSDFHDLYTKVKDKFSGLSKLPFPGKKTFHNMDRSVLERRMKMLGVYMNALCDPDALNYYFGLKDLLMTFLEQGEYDRATGGPISSTINTIVNPLKSGMKTIKNMPEQLINTMDEMVEGISKVFQNKQRMPEPSKVGASIEETDDNIPLRIMLLLMDEVFDLKSRNQWLHRRIVILLRQIIRTMFGDIVNRRILDYVSLITSPKNVAHYLYVFKQSFWPNGIRCEKKTERDADTKNRTRVVAKIALLTCLPDEIKHIVGSETTRRGLLTVFEIFQRPILNRRLLYVLLEGVVCTLFPEKDMLNLFQKLYSKSKRIQSKDKKVR